MSPAITVVHNSPIDDWDGLSSPAITGRGSSWKRGTCVLLMLEFMLIVCVVPLCSELRSSFSMLIANKMEPKPRQKVVINVY